MQSEPTKETNYERISRILSENELRDHMAWTETVAAIEGIKVEIQRMNFGTAVELIDKLLHDLPHDSGPCKSTSMLDRLGEQVRAWRSRSR